MPGADGLDEPWKGDTWDGAAPPGLDQGKSHRPAAAAGLNSIHARETRHEIGQGRNLVEFEQSHSRGRLCHKK